jgi:hypothetical protein
MEPWIRTLRPFFICAPGVKLALGANCNCCSSNTDGLCFQEYLRIPYTLVTADTFPHELVEFTEVDVTRSELEYEALFLLIFYFLIN